MTLITADCRAFEHPDPELRALRRRAGLYRGDFQLRVGWAPAGGGVAAFAERSLRDWLGPTPPPRLEESAPACPADILWDVANFGTFMWSWLKIGGIDGAWGESVGGDRFVARVFMTVPARADVAALDAAFAEALMDFAALPELKGGVARDKVLGVIREDVVALKGIIARAGTFGAAAIEGAFDPAIRCLATPPDGNRWNVFCETRERHYAYHLVTS